MQIVREPSISFYSALLIATLVFVSLPTVGRCEAGDIENWNLKLQSTYVYQHKPSFNASYTGPNSLLPSQERSYSFTATAALGIRLWRGSEFYFNPEVAQGVPLSRLTGFGGFTNGEIA